MRNLYRVTALIALGLPLALGADERSTPRTYSDWQQRFSVLAEDSRKSLNELQRQADEWDPWRQLRAYQSALAASDVLQRAWEERQRRWKQVAATPTTDYEEADKLNSEITFLDQALGAVGASVRASWLRYLRTGAVAAEARTQLWERWQLETERAERFESMRDICRQLHERRLALADADRLLFESALAKTEAYPDQTRESLITRARRLLEGR